MWLAVLAVLTTGYYIEERIRGRRALEKAVADYEADGESLKEEDFLTKAPPVIENFGATPLLYGVMAEKQTDDPRLPEARQRRRDFMIIWPYWEGERNGWLSFHKPVFEQMRKGKKWIVSWQKWADHPDWNALRRDLRRSASNLSPEEKTFDVRAVDEVLDELRESYDELAAAAERRYAVFTPAPEDRPEGGHGFEFEADRFDSFGNESHEWRCFGAAIRLRILAAAVLGRHREAVDLTRVLWRLREARIAEGNIESLWSARYWGCCWNSCVRDIIRSPGIEDGILARLQSHVAASWSPEREMLRAFRGYAASRYAAWMKAIDGVESKFIEVDGAFGEYRFHSNKSLYCPSGWVSQMVAENLRRMQVYYIQPLRKLDFSVLPAAEESFSDLPAADSFLNDDGPGWRLFPPWLPGGETYGLIQTFISYPVRIRLMQLVLGMERYRLRHGRYPAKASDAVPDCIAAVPQDIDGQPLRVVTSADGSKSVVYSVGWNLADDWHGVVPAKVRNEDWENADWAVSLPFPALPPPSSVP